MGADVVELGHKVAERTLLSSHIGTGRPCGTALEDEVHVLVLAVLLGAARLIGRFGPQLKHKSVRQRDSTLQAKQC